MKRAQGKLPHIKWDIEHQCWCAYTFKEASRPVAMYAGFERGLPMAQRFLKKRHDAMVKRRKDAEAARQWYDFRAKHDII